MFITNDAHRSPLSSVFGNLGESYWASTELALHRIWFVMAFRQIDHSETEPLEMSRTILVSDFEQVEQFIRFRNPEDVAIDAVHIITPSHVNGTGDWAMDTLAKVWSVQEPGKASQYTSVYECRSGRRYACSLLGTPIDELIARTLQFEVPYRSSCAQTQFDASV